MTSQQETADEVVCRICFDGADAGELLAACGCSGTQAMVHEACLSRWRRVQLVQGKLAASQRCEICRQKYSSSLSPPSRPLYSKAFDFCTALTESLLGLVIYMTSGGASTGHIAIFTLCYTFGIGTFLKYFLTMFPSLVFLLYMNGLKLSVLSGGGQRHLGLTSFGAPVEGLGKGMLLVALNAGGPFSKTVLYVHEHSDNGSLALILNGPVQDYLASREGMTQCAIKSGGPVKVPGYWCIHNVRGVMSSERIGDRDFFIGTNIGNLRSFVASCQKQCSEEHAPDARILAMRDVSSWGPHQLDGEMRRWAWGWIRPEHVNLDEVFNTPGMVNRLIPPTGRADVMPMCANVAMWEKLVNSPHLEMFHG